MDADPPYDCIVIGAGPGGLTGAIYLGRFRRRVLVLHNDDSRADWIPVSHNHPGFPDGIGGRDLLARMTDQACRYGAEIVADTVAAVEHDGALFQVRCEGRTVAAHAVLLASGVLDNEPKLPDLDDAVRRSLVRICPICDGYELTGDHVGVIGNGGLGAREALFMLTYTPRVTLIHVGEPVTLSPENRAELDAAGVRVLETCIDEVTVEAERVTAVCVGGVAERFDAVYSALGVTPRCRIVQPLDPERDGDGLIAVDDHYRTSVDGLYAVGDLVPGLNQISVAQAGAAIAATDIHNRLRRGEL